MASTPVLAALTVAPGRLAAAFREVPDPRRAASVVYPVAAVLALAAAALLANHRSVLASAEWARQDPATLAALGCADGRTPCQSTLQRLFRRLAGDALAAQLTACFAPLAPPPPAGHGVAVDGKAPRGRLRFAAAHAPTVHALSACCHDSGIVLAHEPITAGADQAEAELTVAPARLARIAWRGRVLTGDALLCQTALAEQVLAADGDSLLIVKENQGARYRAIQLLFAPPAAVPAAPLTDRRVAHTVESGHGRSLERRELVAATDLTDSLAWPGAAQVFRLARTWREHDAPKRTRRSGITSLTPTAADAARLLALRRGHGSIANRLHRHKDVTFGEDASLIHPGAGPTVMALLRDAALSLLHHAGVTRIAARLRTHSQHPEQAVALVLGHLPTGA